MDGSDVTIAVQAAVTFGVALFGYLPWCLGNSARNPRADAALCYLNGMAGGVLFSAGLMHLLPDGIKGLEDMHWFGEFPVPFFLAAAAFMAMMVLELASGPHPKGVHAPPDSVGDGRATAVKYGALAKEEVEISRANGVENGAPRGSSVLLLALCIHSFLEGLGMGSSSGLAQLGIFFAIIAHKGLAGVAVGTSMQMQSASDLCYHFSMIAFASCTPIGAIVGHVLSSSSEDGVAASVCNCLAAGTFLHVSTMEILPLLASCSSGAGDGDVHHHPTVFRILSLLVGFSAMAFLSAYV